MVQEALMLLVLKMLKTHMNSLDKSLALNFFVYKHVESVLGNTVCSSSFGMVTLVKHSFLEHHSFSWCLHWKCLHMCVAKVTPSCFPKGLEKCIRCLSLSLCVLHLGELLEDGSSSQSEGRTIWNTRGEDIPKDHRVDGRDSTWTDAGQLQSLFYPITMTELGHGLEEMAICVFVRLNPQNILTSKHSRDTCWSVESFLSNEASFAQTDSIVSS